MGVWLVVLLWNCQSRLLWRVLPVSRVVSVVGVMVLHLAEFWCLWWHPLLVLECFVFVPSGFLVHCVALWVAPVFEALSFLPLGHLLLTDALWLYHYHCGVAILPSLAFCGSTVIVCPGRTTRMIWVRSSGASRHCFARRGFSTCVFFAWLWVTIRKLSFGLAVAWQTDLSGCRSTQGGRVLVAVWAAVSISFPLSDSWSLVASAARVELGSGIATPGCGIPAVCLPADVATVEGIATSEKASPRSDTTLSWPGWPGPHRPDGLGVPLGPSGGNTVGGNAVAVPCVPALADDPSGGFRKGVPCVPVLARLVLVMSQQCRFYGGCHASSLSPDARHLRACPRDKLLPLPGTPSPVHLCQKVLLQATGVLKPVSPSHCLALRWFRSHVGRPGVGPQFSRTAVVVVA
ncbi:hypothetical protein Taro_047856 [Colocasia esculenta]|uniref:Uncharacterized protein n=1 Tax=Colocasia esculenta TaxID=4460 RepID=A0A843WX26_COLES|nr:hypothetical protein [Colocasia esculenta]